MTAKNRGFLYLLLFHFTTPPPLSFPYQNSFLNLVFNFYHRGEKGRGEIAEVTYPLSWSVQHNFARDG
jgi:hypothetical protein